MDRCTMKLSRRAGRLLAVVAMLGLACGVVQAQVSEGERQALIDFYHATSGDDWLRNYHWLSEEGTECQGWYGVYCPGLQGNQYVTSLRLHANGLRGQLPTSLAGLHRLQWLSLGGNDLEGQIPADRWGLTSLSSLSLGGNRFTGLVPTTILKVPEGAHSHGFNLSDNLLEGFETTGFPDGPQDHAISLNVSGNQIKELPPTTWRQQTRWQLLDMSYNRLGPAVDLEYMPFSGLETLRLAGNDIAQLTGIDSFMLPELKVLDLGDNELSKLPAWLTELQTLEILDLSHNRLSGELPVLPGRMHEVKLTGNQLSGPLPDVDNQDQNELRLLRLSRNHLTGEIPESWETLELTELDLSNNQLSGSIDAAFLALADEHPRWLLLNDNEFTGELPAWVTEIEFEQWPLLGSVNLCWTDVEITDGEVADWVAEHHVGGPDFEVCRNRERRPIDPTVSGSWFGTDRSGEGFSLMLLESGAPLIYWFTHIYGGRQMWLFETGEAAGPTLFLNGLMRTSGFFGEGFGDAQAPIGGKGSVRIDQIESGPLHGEYRISYTTTELPAPGGIHVFMPAPVSMRFDHVRLTQLAGTTCDNHQPNQWISGAWYNPERSGEGFVVEVIEDGRGVVYWFTYEPESGRQAWMMGDGDFDGTTLTIDNLLQPRDTENGMPFDASGIENIHWGTLTIEFDDDKNGHIWFDSVFEEYGSGDYPIERLARPMLAECD